MGWCNYFKHGAHHTRLLQPGLAQLTDPEPPARSALSSAANAYRRALDQLTRQAGLAA